MIHNGDAIDDVTVAKLIEYRTGFQKCGCKDFKKPFPKYTEKDRRMCKHIVKLEREFKNIGKFHTQKLKGMDKYFCTCEEYFGMIKKDVPFKDVKCVHTYIEGILKRKESMRNNRTNKRALQLKSDAENIQLNAFPGNQPGDFDELLDNFVIEPFSGDSNLFSFDESQLDAYASSLAEQFTDMVYGVDEFYPESADYEAGLIARDPWLGSKYKEYFPETMRHLDNLSTLHSVAPEEFDTLADEAAQITNEEAKRFFIDELYSNTLEAIYHMSSQDGLCGGLIGDGLEETLRNLYDRGFLIVDWEEVQDKIEWLLA